MRLASGLLVFSALVTAGPQILVAQRPAQAAREAGATAASAQCTVTTCALRIADGFWRKSLVRGEQAQVVARLDWPHSPSIEHVFEGSTPAKAHATRYARAERIDRRLTFAGAILLGLGTSQDRALNGFTIGGFALLLSSLPFEWAAGLNLDQAIATYNAGLPQQSTDR